MPGIDVFDFGGIMPTVARENLPNGAAQVAINTRLEGSDVEPWRNPALVLVLSSLSDIKTIYKFGMNNGSDVNFWFQWDHDVDVVKGPVASDTEERTYWTGDGYPKKTRANIATVGAPFPSNSLAMGLPVPANAPIAERTGPELPADNQDPKNTSVWGYTYVSSWGEEGAMSPLSNLVTWGTGQTPVLSGMSGAPTGPYDIIAKRIYRSATGTNETDLQFVAEVPVGQTSFTDDVLPSALGGVNITRLFTPPPDELAGLCAMANEIMAGFVGNTVRMSEPGIPYAWPESYSYSFNSPVVGVKSFGQSLLVCCQRGTYLLTGVDPSAMSQETVVGAGICVSKRGMVNIIGGVAYPTTLGLQYVGPDGVRTISEGTFDEVNWGAYNPASFCAAAVNGRYLAFFDTGARQGTLIFSSTAPANWAELTMFGTAMWTDPGADTLYVVINNEVRRWNAGTLATAIWRSKRFRFKRPVSMAFAQVEAETYPLTFRLYGGGNLLHTEAVEDGYAFKLSTDDDEFSQYEFEYEGTSRLSRVKIATSMDELVQF